MGGCSFRNILPINVPKCHGEKICFLTRKFQSRRNSTIWNLVFTLPLRILLKPWTLSFKKDTITAKFVSRRTQKVKIYLANEGSGLAFFSTDLGHICGSNVGNEFGVMLREREDLINQNLLTTLSAYILSWYTRTWLSTISLATRKRHCCVAFLSFWSSRLETL